MFCGTDFPKICFFDLNSSSLDSTVIYSTYPHNNQFLLSLYLQDFNLVTLNDLCLFGIALVEQEKIYNYLSISYFLSIFISNLFYFFLILPYLLFVLLLVLQWPFSQKIHSLSPLLIRQKRYRSLFYLASFLTMLISPLFFASTLKANFVSSVWAYFLSISYFFKTFSHLLKSFPPSPLCLTALTGSWFIRIFIFFY